MSDQLPMYPPQQHDVVGPDSQGTPARKITRPWLAYLQSLTTNVVNSVTHTGALVLNRLIVGNGGQDIRAEALNDGQIPIGATSDGTVIPATITAGANISVTNGAHSITVAATGVVTGPAGSNKDLQYNDSGVFGGDANLTWDKTTQQAAVKGNGNYSPLVVDPLTSSVIAVGQAGELRFGSQVIAGVETAEFVTQAYQSVSFDPGFVIGTSTNETPGQPTQYTDWVEWHLKPTLADNSAELQGADATGAIPGKSIGATRNAAGSGAASTLHGQRRAGTDWYIWQDATGAMRYGPARPTEDNSVSDTSGSLFGTGNISVGSSLPVFRREGERGRMGMPGASGVAGATGSTGPAGPAGIGIPGLRGDRGPAGFGLPGPAGATGAQGPAGASGTTIPVMGPRGDDGRMGVPGPIGPAGPQGPAGPSGSGSGSIGPPGPRGDDGPTRVVVLQQAASASAASNPEVPIVVTTNATVDTNFCWVISERLEIAAGVIFEIANGARVEITGPTNSGLGIGRVLLEEHTANNSLALNFTSWLSPAFDTYEILISKLVPVNNNVLIPFLFSTNGGISYDSTNGNYTGCGFRFVNGANGTAAYTSSIDLAVGVGMDNTIVAGGWSGTITLYNSFPSAAGPRIVGTGAYIRSATDTGVIFNGRYVPTTPVNAFQVAFNTGSIVSGTIRVYGVQR